MKQPKKPSKLAKALAAAMLPPPEGFLITLDHQPGTVVMRFSKAVDRLGFTPAEAFEVAKQLAQHAVEADKADQKIVLIN